MSEEDLDLCSCESCSNPSPKMLRLVETCSHIPENNLQLRLWLPRSFWGFVGTWSIFNSAGQSENIDVPLIHCGQLDYCVSQVIWIQSVDDLIRSFPLTPQWPGSLSVIVGAGVRERWREGGRGGGEMESEKKVNADREQPAGTGYRAAATDGTIW